jgi:hypothetical protein
MSCSHTSGFHIQVCIHQTGLINQAVVEAMFWKALQPTHTLTEAIGTEE